MKQETAEMLNGQCLGFGVPQTKVSNHVPDYLAHLTKEQINSQITDACTKCGSVAKTSALNRDTGRIMITCLKCQDWVDFK